MGPGCLELQKENRKIETPKEKGSLWEGEGHLNLVAKDMNRSTKVFIEY